MAMKATGILVAAALIVTATAEAADAAAARWREYSLQVEANYRRLLQLQTRGPQPWAVEVVPHLQNVKPSESVTPRQTVLHRCDMLACCGVKDAIHFHCVPTVETVDLYFHATDIRTLRRRAIVHQFQNHTRCDCLSKTDDL